VAGGVVLIGFLITLALLVVAIWVVTLVTISIFRRVRSR
jgi:hypothetical protein